VTGVSKYLYGPVPSRRLGLSYGIDIVPRKTCTLDCVYCQVGRTTERTIARKDFGSIQPVLTELRTELAAGAKADFVTIGGSGEPTLHTRLGELIDGIKQITDIPVALLTNGTLFYRPDVRADCAKVDVAMPSLDAGDEQTFQKIDRPEPAISIEKVISGLCAFRREFAGQIWLEVFLVRSMNTAPSEIASLRNAIGTIRPDKVQLNTAVRPTADPDVVRLSADEMEEIAAQLGPRCEVIADFSRAGGNRATLADMGAELGLHSRGLDRMTQALLSMLKRRPCSLEDICAGLALGRSEASRFVAELLDRGLVERDQKDGRVFFKPTP